MRRGTRIIALGTTAVIGSALACAPAEAATTVEHGQQRQVDVNPNTENPCTGALGELVDDERDSWTVVQHADGSYLARGHSVTTVTFTPYGKGVSYYGHEVYSDVEHVGRGATGFRSAGRVRVHGTDGSTLVVLEIHRTVIGPDGTVRVQRDIADLTCRSAG